MAVHRTAQGRTLDMATLIAKNEKIRAVGNMKVNARGDTIDGKGNIVKPRNQQVTEQYGKTIGARPLQPNKSTPKKVEPIIEDKLPTEQDFNDTEDLEIERIKQQEAAKKGKK